MTTNNKQSLILATARNKQRITLFLNPAIAKQAKAEAIIEELSLTALVERALIKYLPDETKIRKSVIRTDPIPLT